VTACVDSDVFDGIPAAAEELSRYGGLVIGRISWMEVLAGAPSEDLRLTREDFLRQFSIVELDEPSLATPSDCAKRRLKLPDAIRWASARLNEALLVTHDTRDFPAHESGVRIPCQV
jgi:predicted nucleic acid-binding protein